MVSFWRFIGTLIALTLVPGQGATEINIHEDLDPWEVPEHKQLHSGEGSNSRVSMEDTLKLSIAIPIIVVVQLLVYITTYFSKEPKEPKESKEPKMQANQEAPATRVPTNPNNFKSLMRVLDTDNDGIITQEELATAISAGVFKNAAHQGETTTLRVIKCTHQVEYIRTQCSLASKIFGEGSKVEAVFFSLGAKNKSVTAVVWGLWWLGCSISLFTLADFFQESCLWAALLMLPLPIVTLPVLCADLLKNILQEFEFYILSASSIWIFCCALIIEERMWLFWFCALPTVLIAPLVDAYPARYRTYFAKHFFLGVTCIIIVWNGLILDGRTLHMRKIEVHAGGYTSSFTSHTVTASIGLVGFCLNFLYTMFAVPNQFVILRAPLITLHEEFALKKEDAEGGQRKVLERFKTQVRIQIEPHTRIR